MEEKLRVLKEKRAEKEQEQKKRDEENVDDVFVNPHGREGKEKR